MKSHPLCTSATTMRKRERDYPDVDCVATKERERGSISVMVMHQRLRCGVGQYLGFVNFFFNKAIGHTPSSVPTVSLSCIPNSKYLFNFQTCFQPSLSHTHVQCVRHLHSRDFGLSVLLRLRARGKQMEKEILCQL